MELYKELEKYRVIIDQLLDEALPNNDSMQLKVFEAMRYSVFAGGKRLRPILIMKGCELISGSYEASIPFALAIEMIHTYSLIHDDLPAMDDDDFRRGKLTNHKVFGEAVAILAGDGLLNLAYEIMIDHLVKNYQASGKYPLAMYEIAKASGVSGMIGGQIVDILSDNSNMDEDTLKFIDRNKTSALIEASIVAGGIIGGATAEEVSSLKEYGKAIGLGYQIRDDILDKIGTIEKLGKDIGSDEENGKFTYLTLFGLEKAIAKTEELCQVASSSLNIFSNKDTEFLRELAEYLVYRES